MFTIKCIFLFLCVSTLSNVLAQSLDTVSLQNPCVSKLKCNECIQTPSCAWCFDPDFGERPRCFQPSLTPNVGKCNEAFTYNPDNEQAFLEHRDLTKASSVSGSGSASASASGSGSAGAGGSASSSGEIVQISPQRVGLKLRISMF